MNNTYTTSSLFNKVSGNGLLYDDTNPLPVPMLNYCQQEPEEQKFVENGSHIVIN